MSKAEPWIAASVDCPFYLWSNGKTITCEGHTVGIKAQSVFSAEAERHKYMKRVCGPGFKSCPTFQAAMKKYEDK